MEKDGSPKDIVDQKSLYDKWLEIQEKGVDMTGCFLDENIEELHFTMRILHCLQNEDINTIGELSKLSTDKLKSIRNMGKKSVEEIQERIELLGIHLEEG